ncbi:MAG: RDD family protein [Myxococcota bacterium]
MSSSRYRAQVTQIDTTATVDTPELVRFRFRLAGPGPRAVAWLVDFGVMSTLFAVGFVVAQSFAVVEGLGGVGRGLLALLAFGLQWLYGVVFEVLWSGRTPGKAVMSLRVVRADGSPGRFPDFLLRNLLRFVDFLPAAFGLGVLVMAMDGKLRRIGDLVGGTIVVVEQRTHVLAAVPIVPPVTSEERQALPARVDLSRSEVRAIEALLRRRSRLTDERAEELAAFFAPEVTRRTGIEADSAERVLTLAYARVTGRDRDEEPA